MAQDKIEEIIQSIPEDLRQDVIETLVGVLEVENSKLHMSRARNINEELLEVIKEIVK